MKSKKLCQLRLTVLLYKPVAVQKIFDPDFLIEPASALRVLYPHGSFSNSPTKKMLCASPVLSQCSHGEARVILGSVLVKRSDRIKVLELFFVSTQLKSVLISTYFDYLTTRNP